MNCPISTNRNYLSISTKHRRFRQHSLVPSILTKGIIKDKAGGIKLCRNEDEVWSAADELLGKHLVTPQTSPRGKGVYRLYVEAACHIERELYLGFVLDRKSERIMVIASAAGGMEIEDISHQKPDSIIRVEVEPGRRRPLAVLPVVLLAQHLADQPLPLARLPSPEQTDRWMVAACCS